MNQEITPDRSGHLKVGDQKIWWEYHGEGDREAVCLLNGLAMHTKAWYGFLPMLSDEYDVILYDFLGQGESSKEDIPYFIDELAHHLEPTHGTPFWNLVARYPLAERARGYLIAKGEESG